jgi:hypothetical protein
LSGCKHRIFQPSSQIPCSKILKKGKALPLQVWSGPEGSRSLRLPAHEGGKVVSPTHRTPLPPGNIRGTHFC